MLNKRFTLILAMLVLVIFAVGSVSAEENVTADIDVPTEEVVIDEVDVDDDPVDDAVESEKVVEPTRLTTTYSINNSYSSSAIDNLIDTGSSSNKVIINFANQTYSNIALDLTGNVNVELWGNGATLNGDGTHDIFTVTNSHNIVIKDFIINVDSGAAAIYGHHVYDSVYTNNTITGGKDGINIFQIHENLTITDNNISGFTRDGISLVNFDTMNDTTWANFVASNVSGNKITGGQYGMFFGGNYKGVISNNDITGSGVGIEFAGKKAATNGRLDVELNYNTIVGVTTGISMNHPDVISFKMLNNTVNSTSNTTFAILAGNNFDVDDDAIISLINNTFYGYTSSAFYYEITEDINNTGLVRYP